MLDNEKYKKLRILLIFQAYYECMPLSDITKKKKKKKKKK